MRMPPSSVNSPWPAAREALGMELLASRLWHSMEDRGFQLGFGISEGGKNSVPNVISDLEPGPKNSS